MFGGIGLLQALVAALGAALCVGNAAAIVRSRRNPNRRPTWSDRQNRRDRAAQVPTAAPKLVPAVTMAVVGFLIFAWAVASMIGQN